MRLGIMSDSHGRVERVREALEVLAAEAVDAIAHCGDIGGLEVLEELAGRRCWFVWGNTDCPQPAWRAEIESLGLTWPDGPLDFALDGKRLALYHGHEPTLGQAIRSGNYDYVLHGHTHRAADLAEGSTRVINPGALYRVAVPTVAVLDVETGDLRFVPVNSGHL